MGIALRSMAWGRPQRVLLVGFQDQDNLGLRYLCSAVRAAGHKPDILTFDADSRGVIERSEVTQPDVIGFSLIFQYMTPKFGNVITALRGAGFRGHITIGGHYPSFAYESVLKSIPALDSVVRFDGEVTLVSLLNCLSEGRDWRDINGIAYRLDDRAVKANLLREPVADLDELPWPERTDIKYESNPLATASVLGSRGCPWNCSFCSIRPFYEQQGGKLRRLRQPDAIVGEIIDLHQRRNVNLFLFQDDDFLASGRRARQWAGAIADRLVQEGIAHKTAFKISCRSDEIDPENMQRLMRGGLTHIYMGVESGDLVGLENLNKKLKPEVHLKAAAILKSLGLSFDFGFMLMEPWSTFLSIRNNISFLEAFVGDGWSVASFCRMLPYAGTSARAKLAEEGRLQGTEFQPDYQFLEPKLDFFYDWLIRTFYMRNFTSEGLCHVLRYLMFEARLRVPSVVTGGALNASILQYFTASANKVACTVLRAGLDHIERMPLKTLRPDDEFLTMLTEWEIAEEDRLMHEIRAYIAASTARRSSPGIGGFDQTWTFATSGRKSTGISTA